MSTKPKLLIVDDDEDIRAQMRWSLSSEYEIAQAGNREGAVQQFKEHRPPVVLLDLGLPPSPNLTTEGMATLQELLQLDPRTKVIIISGQGEREHTLQAIGQGAYDFLSKPVNSEELQFLLQRCFYVSQLESEYRELQKRAPAKDAFEGMLGTSAAMQQVFNLIRKVATSDAPVMVLGESGTGKEMVANAIHRQGARKDGPFVAINCSAIPETLLESELFGHEKGTFTGADDTRAGKIEQADGGTLFLDEIGEVPLNVQVKLLRFLQERYVERVGGRKPIPVDTRIVAATNVDLQKAMKEGTFREDFYFRLAVVEIELPPLRERGEDIDYLAKAFLKTYAAESGAANLSFSPAALEAIRANPWTGNVRELQNRIRRAAIMCEGSKIEVADLQIPENAKGPTYSGTLKEAREQLERDLLTNALEKHQGKITAVSKELGISRPTIYEMMDRFGLKR